MFIVDETQKTNNSEQWFIHTIVDPIYYPNFTFLNEKNSKIIFTFNYFCLVIGFLILKHLVYNNASYILPTLVIFSSYMFSYMWMAFQPKVSQIKPKKSLKILQTTLSWPYCTVCGPSGLCLWYVVCFWLGDEGCHTVESLSNYANTSS